MATFSVTLSYKGNSVAVPNISHETTNADLLFIARDNLRVADGILLKLLYRGKIIAQDATSDTRLNIEPAFSRDTKIPSTGAKVIVMGTEAKGIQILNAGRSDPLMRGFDDELPKKTQPTSYWGGHGIQNKQYKFCRLQECTDASFGTRPGASTPHAFEARRLLEKLSTDPGIVAILVSRELLVGTLGEMDPIDDRLMQKKQQQGACLLGYNTNHGMRIDVKLRSDDLSSFRPYSELASTLIHELSHNWVGEHNALFWTNYAQMRVEYLWKHACLMLGADFVNGKRTAELAGIMKMIVGSNHAPNTIQSEKAQLMQNITTSVVEESAHEMAQHHIPVQIILPAILEFAKDMIKETEELSTVGGNRLGGSSSQTNDTTELSRRDLALAAAERRAREKKQDKKR